VDYVSFAARVQLLTADEKAMLARITHLPFGGGGAVAADKVVLNYSTTLQST